MHNHQSRRVIFCTDFRQVGLNFRNKHKVGLIAHLKTPEKPTAP
ncbi:hypothetical protein HMPREF9996_02180 [Aggregatibacter actinomycetemcomitans Y4]|nr:hypothetical protein HMPREF9996_02180 [Aggregatibacter actinomycetemcomitans Y4]